MVTRADVIREAASVFNKLVELRKQINLQLDDADIADDMELVAIHRNLKALSIDVRNQVYLLNEMHQALMRKHNEEEASQQIAAL